MRHICELQAELTEIEQQTAPLDIQINLATVQLRELLEMQERDEAASEATNQGSTVLTTDLDNLRAQKQDLSTRSVTLCKPGQVLYGDCTHVKEHLAHLDRLIADEQRKTLPEVSSREQSSTELANQARRQNSPLERLRQKLKQLNGDKNDLMERRRVVNDLLKRIPLATSELLKWHWIVSGKAVNHDLSTLEMDEEQKVKESDHLKKQLNEALVRQNERASQFGQRFHKLVQATINATFKGGVIVEDDGIVFRINRERSLAGEAYETLAVLLADLAILMESSSESVCHPGLLIHDSPREADLNVRLYERMLETAYALMDDERGNTPYQYIVTTTTQPSEALRSPNVTRVTLSSGNGSLFGRQLESGDSGASQKTLFDATEDYK